MSITYCLRSTKQCNPDSTIACVRSMNDNCKVGMIIERLRWHWDDVNEAYRQASAYNNKVCGCRAEVVEIKK